VSSSFPIDFCQIKEFLLDDFDLHVSHSRSGNPIKKVNQSVNRFHASVLPDTHHKMRVCLADLNLNWIIHSAGNYQRGWRDPVKPDKFVAVANQTATADRSPSIASDFESSSHPQPEIL
jgi:hypothetical protein